MNLWPTSNAPKLTLGTHAPALPLFSTKVVLPAQFVSAHKHIIGVSKMGKSKLLEAIFMQLMAQNIGVSFVDPHGDSAESILAMLIQNGFFQNPDNYKRFLYVEFLEDDYFMPFNILKVHRDQEGLPRVRIATLAENVLEAFHRCWPALDQGAAPRFDDILGKGAQVLIANHLPITCMTGLLTNKAYRNYLLSNVSNPDILAFFSDRFDQWAASDAAMMKESTLSRISLLTDSDILKNSLGQSENELDFRSIIDQGICVVYNLSQIQNKTAQKFLGCLLTLGYESAANARAGTLPHLRRPHHFIFDEFHKLVVSRQVCNSVWCGPRRRRACWPVR